MIFDDIRIFSIVSMISMIFNSFDGSIPSMVSILFDKYRYSSKVLIIALIDIIESIDTYRNSSELSTLSTLIDIIKSIDTHRKHRYSSTIPGSWLCMVFSWRMSYVFQYWNNPDLYVLQYGYSGTTGRSNGIIINCNVYPLHINHLHKSQEILNAKTASKSNI